MKTYQEREDMVKALLEIRPKIPERTGFGDSNHDAIDAQIQVIETNMTENVIYDTWEDNDHVRDNALLAYDWLFDREEEDILEGWKGLVGAKVKILPPPDEYFSKEE